MRITKVAYTGTYYLGDSNEERITMTSVVDEGETPEQVITQLRERVKSTAEVNTSKFYNRRYELQGEVDSLEQKLSKVQEQWNQTAEFLRTQGIKPDAPNMPSFTNLLPAVKEHVIEGELEEDDEEPYCHDDEDDD